MRQNYKIIEGSEVRGSELRLPRAVSIYNAALIHKQAAIKSCRRKSDGSEVIIMTLSRLEIPEEPEYAIQLSEDVAVRCLKEDINMPEVYAVRKDFPIGLPHSNVMPFAHPVSLCISDVLFADIKPQFNAYDFINLIIRWFNLNSIGELHEKDRPLEVFFQYHNFCGLRNSLPTTSPFYGLYKKSEPQASTLEFVDKNKANYDVFPIVTAMNISKNLAYLPKNIGKLTPITSLSGKSVPQELLDAICNTSGKSTFCFSVLLMVQLRRESQKEMERLDVAFIRTKESICDTIRRKRYMKEDKFKTWFESVPIEIDMLIDYPSKCVNRLQNGKENLCDNVTFVGTGTLGANIIDHFVREGIVSNIKIVDYDFYHSHNVSRHVLPPKDIMQLKAKAIKQHYTGIDGVKIYPINKNALSLQAHEMEYAFVNTDLIIDVSTSIAVERMLADKQEYKGVRKCCAFLNPKGSDIVLFMEDNQQIQRLDLLEMSYLYNILTSNELSKHLDTSEQRRTNNFSCRSESNILDYDNIVMLSSVISQQIQRAYKSPNSFLGIWRVNVEDSTIQKFNLKVLSWKYKNINGITVRYSSELVNRIENLKNNDLSKETGGCLFGCYDKTLASIYVFYGHPAPMDSKCSRSFFERGCQGMVNILQEIDEKTFHQVRYLGEWHTHPHGCCSPSNTDKEQFKKMSNLLKQEDLPFVQFISGDDGIYINATF